MPGSDPAKDATTESKAGPTSWALTSDAGNTLIKAGTTQGLALNSQLTLLGPALAGTDNRQVVGSATVVEVWADLSRIVPDRLRTDGIVAEAARLPLPEDKPILAGIPVVSTEKPPSAADAAPVIPPDLTGGTVASRIDALVRYEPDPSATAIIVWVMKNDASDEVRTKAWRVLRARWKAGTGAAADHEAAAVWLAANGTTDLRVEALNAIGDYSSTLRLAARHLTDDVEAVRAAAARAVHDMGMRTGKRAEARRMLEERRDAETVNGLRKKMGEWIAEL